MKKVDAIFINGPFLQGFSRESRSPAVTKSGTLYYPGWLAYACGYSEERGYNCILKDCIADKLTYEESINFVIEHNPKFIIIGTSTPSIDADLKFAKDLKNKLKKSILILVGTHASTVARELISEFDFIDFVARREYDVTVFKLLEAFKNNVEWKDIKRITYKNDNGAINHNTDQPYLHDLDVLPFASKVYKDHLNIKNYYYGHIRYPMVSIFTSRGCNARCNYCLYPQTMFGNFRSRSPKNIADEFVWIAKNLPEVKEVLIDDDTFTMNKAHAVATAKEMIKVNNKVKWSCEARGNLDYETLTLMKKAGCKLIVTGFESVDQDVLNKVNKGIKMDVVDKYVDDAAKAGIKIHACFMAGNPGDTIKTLQTTLEWAIKKDFDTIQFFPLQVYPGTKAYEWAIQTGYIREQDFRSWVSPTGMHNMTMNLNDKGLTYQQCLDFCVYARRKFYLRPSFILKKVIRGIFEPQEFKKNVIGFLNIRKHLFRKVSSELK